MAVNKPLVTEAELQSATVEPDGTLTFTRESGLKVVAGVVSGTTDAQVAEFIGNGTLTKMQIATTMATDPAVADAVTTMAQNDAGLARRADEGMPGVNASEDVLEVLRDARGRVLYERRADGRLAESYPVTQAGVEHQAINGEAGWMPFLVDGRMPPFTLDERGYLARHTIGVVQRQVVPAMRAPVAVGDSITEGVGQPTSYPAELAALTGWTVLNHGISGYTPSGLELLSGAVPVLVTASAGVPASGASTVTVSIGGAEAWSSGSTHSFAGVLVVSHAGGVEKIPGTLSRTSAGVWSFTRASAGSAITVVGEARFVGEHQDDLYRPAIIWHGRNGTGNPAATEYATRMRVAAHRAHGAPVALLSVLNAQNEPFGSPGYATIAAINATREAIDPNAYIDIRSLFVQHGMEVMGLTRTPDDETAKTEDRPAPSLMADNLHPNANGYRAIARLLAPRLTQMGFFR